MPVFNLYSFPIELKPRIAQIQIYETVKIKKVVSSLSEDITCYFHCLSYWEISIYVFHRKAYKKVPFYHQKDADRMGNSTDPD